VTRNTRRGFVCAGVAIGGQIIGAAAEEGDQEISSRLSDRAHQGSLQPFQVRSDHAHLRLHMLKCVLLSAVD
jgi:hypothetical protein